MRRLSILLCLLGFTPAFSQLIQQESFEAAPSPATYSISSPFINDGGGQDFFERGTDSDFISHGMDAAPLTGEDGSNYIGAEDTDPTVIIGGEVRVTLAAVSISGLTNLNTTISIAAFNNMGYDSPNISSGDYVYVEYQIDGGGWNTIGAFTGGIAPATNSNQNLREDTDFDDYGDGTIITETFQDFNFNIPGGGTNLEVRVRLRMDAGDEEVAIDNIRVFGTAAGPCAQPSAQPTGLTFSNISTTSLDGNFISEPTASAYLVVASTSSSLGAVPVDGNTYSNGASLGSGTVVDFTVITSFTATGLIPGTQYYFFIFAADNAGTSGCPDYLTAAPLSSFTYTLPDNVSLSQGCIDASSIDLSWAFGAGGYDGVVIFARQGAVPTGPGVSENADDFTANSNYSAAADLGAQGRCIYKGNGNNVTITGLTGGLNYTFRAYTFRDPANSDWSSGTQTTATIQLNEVIGAITTLGSNNIIVNWTNPPLACFNEILVVANETAGIGFSPSGSYIGLDNSVYGGPDQVVYAGSGNSVDVTSLTPGTVYYFEIFVRRGGVWSAGIEVFGSPTQELFPGDLVFIGYDNNIGSAVDAVAITNLVAMSAFTSFTISNSTYELGDPALIRSEHWFDAGGTGGTNLGAQRITLHNAVAKGSIICLELPSSTGAGAIINTISINGVTLLASEFTVTETGNPGSSINFSTSNPDPMFLMQGSFSIQASYATFSGRVLGGIMEGGIWYEVSDDLSALPNGQAKRRSRRPPDIECIAIQGNNTPSLYYSHYQTTALHSGAHGAILGAILNYGANWSGGAGDATNNFPVNMCTSTFTVVGAGLTAGLWRGGASGDTENWFNCLNWDNFQVPDETIDVTVPAGGSFHATVSATAPFSDCFEDTARCASLTVEENSVRVESNNDVLEVQGNLVLRDLSIFQGSLDMDNGGTEGGTLLLSGNWTNENGPSYFHEGKSTVVFKGTGLQSVTIAGSAAEGFYNLNLNNSGAGLLLNDDIAIDANALDEGMLSINQGLINANGQTVVIMNRNSNAISHSLNNYIYGGFLSRRVQTGSTIMYDFPLGTNTHYELAIMTLDAAANFAGAGVDSITVSFTNPTNGPISASLNMEGGLTYNEMLDGGFWTFERATPLTSGFYDLELHLRGSTNAGVGADFVVMKRNNALTDWEIQGSLGAAPINGGAVVTAYRDMYTSFSDFGIAKPNPVLPVAWLEFEAYPEESSILLNWVVSEEQNLDLFRVEKSLNGRDFFEIGQQIPHSNSNLFSQYQFIDHFPYPGLNYYQITALDADGQSSRSTIVEVYWNPVEWLQLYPNPSGGKVTLSYLQKDDGGLQWEVYALDGKRVKAGSENLGPGQHQKNFDWSALSPGLYLFQIKINQQIFTIKWEKQI